MRPEEIEASVQTVTKPISESMEAARRGLQPISEVVGAARAQVVQFSAQQEAIIAGARRQVLMLLPPPAVVHLSILSDT